MEWPGNLNEYDKLVIRMNTPRVVIDNAVCATATLVKVDSARKHEILLEAVQVLTDLNLCIRKAYISSDGRWFMDVFHVTDQNGDKLTDESVLRYIERIVATNNAPRSSGVKGLTALELTGTDLQSQNNVEGFPIWFPTHPKSRLKHVRGCGRSLVFKTI